MKKIFTLCAVAMAALSMNAQDVISASQKEVFDKIEDAVNHPTDNANANFIQVTADQKVYPAGTYAANATEVKLADGSNVVLKDFNWTATKGNISITAVCTPNTDDQATPWNKKYNTNHLEILTSSDTVAYQPKSGNASVAYKDFYELNDAGNQNVHRVYDQPWTPGCGTLPAKGGYYKVTSKADGNVTFGFILAKNLIDKQLYIVDGSTSASGYALVPASSLIVKGYRQNNKYEVDNNIAAKQGDFLTVKISETGIISYDAWGSDTNRNFLGYVTWPAKANVDYYVFSPNCQLAFFSVRTGGIPDPSIYVGISTVKADNTEAVAPVKRIENGRILIGNYNLAGQRVK